MMLVHLMVHGTDLVEWGIFTLFLIKKKNNVCFGQLKYQDYCGFLLSSIHLDPQ